MSHYLDGRDLLTNLVLDVLHHQNGSDSEAKSTVFALYSEVAGATFVEDEEHMKNVLLHRQVFYNLIAEILREAALHQLTDSPEQGLSKVGHERVWLHDHMIGSLTIGWPHIEDSI